MMNDNDNDNDNNRLTDPFDTTDESPVHRFVAGRTTGKTKKFAEELDETIREANEESEWIDPKGEADSRDRGESFARGDG